MESITSELIGQLGNQLFNWATGYSIARQNNWHHFVDDSKIQEWGCYLDQFGIEKMAKFELKWVERENCFILFL